MSGYIFITREDNKQLFTVTPGGNSITLPAGKYVNNFVIKPTVDELIDISDVSDGGTELEEQMPCGAGVSSNVVIETLYDEDTTIYFANLTAAIQVTVYFL